MAERLHAAAIHLLRRLRAEDDASGLSAPRLSALSVLVFGGPRTIGELAAAEQVRPPTISRLVRELERDGLVRRTSDPADARVQRLHATPAAEALLLAGRARRVAKLQEAVAALAPAERRLLGACLPLLERLARPEVRGATARVAALPRPRPVLTPARKRAPSRRARGTLHR
jgi:DNA-binding MarR family transcriptional regulator